MLNLLDWNKPIKVNGKIFNNSKEAYDEFKDFNGEVEVELNFNKTHDKNGGTDGRVTVDNEVGYTIGIVEIPRWLAKSNKCPIILKGNIERETDKAIYFNGVGLIENPVYCCVCGRELTNPISKKLGIGPDCAEKMFGVGFSNPSGLKNEMAEKSFKVWLPKSQIKFKSI